MILSDDEAEVAGNRMAQCMAEAGFKGRVVTYTPSPERPWALGWLPDPGAKHPGARDCWRARETSLSGEPLCFEHALAMARGEDFECRADRRFVEDCGA